MLRTSRALVFVASDNAGAVSPEALAVLLELTADCLDAAMVRLPFGE